MGFERMGEWDSGNVGMSILSVQNLPVTRVVEQLMEQRTSGVREPCASQESAVMTVCTVHRCYSN